MNNSERRWKLYYYRFSEEGELEETPLYKGSYSLVEIAVQKGNKLIKKRDVGLVEIQDLEDKSENRPFRDALYRRFTWSKHSEKWWPFEE